MWGYFLGREYAHRRYGPTRHSLATTPTFLNSWYRVNEIRSFDWEHIPSGFLHDIIDINIYNQANGLNDNPTNIPDHISGFGYPQFSIIWAQILPQYNTPTKSDHLLS